jgi:hypothetical protein
MRTHQSKTHIKKRVQYDAQRIYLFKFTPPNFRKSLIHIYVMMNMVEIL